jgi:hypothetical protein
MGAGCGGHVEQVVVLFVGETEIRRISPKPFELGAASQMWHAVEETLRIAAQHRGANADF